MKAFLVNRVGDFGFILGIGLMYAYAGTLTTPRCSPRPGTGQADLPGRDWMLITGHLHLPVHRRHGQVGAVPAARVAAGFDGRPDADLGADPRRHHGDGRHLHGGAHVAAVRAVDTALNFVLVIGAITALFMGFLGIIQNDIKRVVAYSTLSQLGYMTVALGVSAYSVAVFHLMTHAFFKALLFLGRRLGDHRHAPRPGHPLDGRPAQVHADHLDHLAARARWRLIGTPLLFSGFYSKDSITARSASPPPSCRRRSGSPSPASRSQPTSTCSTPAWRTGSSVRWHGRCACSSASTVSMTCGSVASPPRASSLGRAFWKGGDTAVIDGVLVDGSAAFVDRVAGVARQLQTGRLYHYAFAMILGLIALLGALLWALR
jgi:NADH:ubiquinone oxidoreductase subunit 5 (subunit L)/multisubunit Na+/H+ antiporter MnhA subunit